MMAAGIAGLLLLVVQLAFLMQWENDQTSLKKEYGRVAEEVRELDRLTTKTETTMAFDQALDMAHGLEKEQPAWEELLQPLLGSVQLDGQLTTIEAGNDGILKVTSVYLSEEEVTRALKKLEAAPDYRNMKLAITEHVKGETPGRLRLVGSDGQVLRLDNVDYYTLALEIGLKRQEGTMP